MMDVNAAEMEAWIENLGIGIMPRGFGWFKKKGAAELPATPEFPINKRAQTEVCGYLLEDQADTQAELSRPDDAQELVAIC